MTATVSMLTRPLCFVIISGARVWSRAAAPAGLAVLDEGGEGAESNEELRRLYHTNDDEQADTDPKATDATPTPEPEAARFSVDYSRGEVLLESSDESDDDDDEGQESVRTAV